MIPTHKGYDRLSSFERMTLSNTLEKLHNYPIIFVLPKGVSVDGYKDLGIKDFLFFDGKYFRNIESYCELMLSTFFYELFKEYDYMLIAQLDAYIFEDKLDYFMDMGYDYIGCLHTTPHTGNELINGNGGLSLRKISGFIEATKHIKEDLKGIRDWEDILYSYWYKDKMNIAPYEVSLQFGWQQYPEMCYEKNGNCLPFGAHKPHIFGKDFNVFKEILKI